jgi:hypothetical protein
MGRRSDFQRVHKDYYPTPRKAVEPLLKHLEPGTRFIEPCAGDGRLVRHLQYFGHVCVGAFDIEPRHPQIKQGDARRLRGSNIPMWITNCPWSRPVLHRIIENLAAQAPLWTIIDANWAHTTQAAEYLRYCHKIVSIGRIEWIEGTGMSGKDDAAFYLFDMRAEYRGTQFFGNLGS